MPSTGSIKVLIVDDSAIVRTILSHALSAEADIRVVGGAKDPYEAREFIIKFRPDVIILDIEMPRMDGLTFLKKLQSHYPVPVIMCSGVAPANSHAALTAIELGAVDVVAKPDRADGKALRHLCEDLAFKIRAAAIAAPPRPSIPTTATREPLSCRAIGLDPKRCLVAIGASTGGTEAIKHLLAAVPADFPPVAIVQHMPAGFTKSFAERLNQFSAMTVTEAADGDLLAPGRAFVARGGIQMGLRLVGDQWRVVYGRDEPVNRHCPSVDVLFDSIARKAGTNTAGILLTGMGADGAEGLLTMRNAGAVTIAQDEDSCVVYGMPKVAVKLGAAQRSAPPADVPRLVLQALRNHAGKKKSTTAQAANGRRADEPMRGDREQCLKAGDC